jgi:chromosomal replication initiation ATPase DnaA
MQRDLLHAPGARAKSSLSSDAKLCDAVGKLVAAALGVSARALFSPTRGAAPVAFARQVAVYLGHVVFGVSLSRLARGFGRDRATARYACRVVEDARDDPAIDRMLDALELACRDLARGPQAGAGAPQ